MSLVMTFINNLLRFINKGVLLADRGPRPLIITLMNFLRLFLKTVKNLCACHLLSVKIIISLNHCLNFRFLMKLLRKYSSLIMMIYGADWKYLGNFFIPYLWSWICLFLNSTKSIKKFLPVVKKFISFWGRIY